MDAVLGYKKATKVFLVLEKYWVQENYRQTWRYKLIFDLDMIHSTICHRNMAT
jgi:hypothetical protein